MREKGRNTTCKRDRYIYIYIYREREREKERERERERGIAREGYTCRKTRSGGCAKSTKTQTDRLRDRTTDWQIAPPPPQ